MKKLSFTLAGYELFSWKFEEMHEEADVVETVVEAVERKGLKLFNKIVKGTTKMWVRHMVD